MNLNATVFIVDDDIAMRDSLSLLLGLKGVQTQVFAAAADLLTAYDPKWFGCMLFDVRMPGMSGLELHAELVKRQSDLPVVIMTAYGDATTARLALKAGVVDFLEKPFDDAVMLDVLQSAIQSHAALRQALPVPKGTQEFTLREQRVMELDAAGLAVAQIAEKLGISPRTVEVYKSRLAHKRPVRESERAPMPASASAMAPARGPTHGIH